MRVNSRSLMFAIGSNFFELLFLNDFAAPFWVQDRGIVLFYQSVYANENFLYQKTQVNAVRPIIDANIRLSRFPIKNSFSFILNMLFYRILPHVSIFIINIFYQNMA